jgi:hypothetical protein
MISDQPASEKLSDEELQAKISSLLQLLSAKYEIEPDKIMEFMPKPGHIPVSIFSSELSPLESLVIYLRDYLQMDFLEISSQLKRHYQTIWTSYHLAKRKGIELNLERESAFVPIAIFQTRKTTIFECLVCYLKKEHKLSEISHFLNRDYRTIWTIAKRAERKLNAKA